MKMSELIEISGPQIGTTAIQGLRDKFIEHAKIEDLGIDLTIDKTSKKINNFIDKITIQMFYSFLWGGLSNVPLLVLNFETMLPGIMCWIETLPQDQKEPALKTLYQINDSFEAVFGVTFWPKETNSGVIKNYEENLSKYNSSIAVNSFQQCMDQIHGFIESWNDAGEGDFSYSALTEFLFFMNDLYEQKFGKGFMKVEVKTASDFLPRNGQFKVVH